ncbi:MAG: phosphoribosylformylglycinamidine synthase subunit PurL [Bacillota bacterium]|nr:phosphoribosylformylglycinamidine synthase subunit PurL [Bacillota bacterium]
MPSDDSSAGAVPVWETVGLTAEEYRRIQQHLDRDPNHVELGMYGLMWSEHCSYKSSKNDLRRFPTKGPQVIQGPGENAGAVDIGDGLAVVFKMESHNHPSAIEPYQGAATGVGGILRDIFTMGARPIALLDSLRFGPLDDARSRYLFGGVVAGISGYGNCVGVPTVGGEVQFEGCYGGNPLVNVMCVGLVRRDGIVLGRAAGPGNALMLVGSKTGRDGIHGASLLASREFDEKSEEMRPSVQVGDPFLKKLLIEACLEVLRSDDVIGLNDLGAAGLTSSSSETASRGGAGMDLDVALVPRREEGMTPYEVMLSESQERMLVIVRAGAEERVSAVFRRWGLDAVVIGRVTDGDRLIVREDGRVVADMPVQSLTAGGPVYDRPVTRPAYLDRTATISPAARAAAAVRCREPADNGGTLGRILASPAIASKAWVYRQYDHVVQTNTVLPPGGADAAVLRIRGTAKGLSVATDGNGRYTYLDPRAGGRIAVAEAARNVACTGAKPLAMTNCLNFGNPEDPEIAWQFREAIAGMAEACEALGTPVTGGNVSFYNETMGESIYPTPVVGMLGVLPDVEKRLATAFGPDGSLICLLTPRVRATAGATSAAAAAGAGLAGSEYLKTIHGEVAGVPEIDLGGEAAVQATLVDAAGAGLLLSAHDAADGGLAVCVAECCIAAAAPDGTVTVGAEVEVDDAAGDHAALFGEWQSRVAVSVDAAAPDKLKQLIELARRYGAECSVIGRVTTERRLVIRAKDTGRVLVSEDLAALAGTWRGALSCLMG